HSKAVKTLKDFHAAQDKIKLAKWREKNLKDLREKALQSIACELGRVKAECESRVNQIRENCREEVTKVRLEYNKKQQELSKDLCAEIRQELELENRTEFERLRHRLEQNDEEKCRELIERDLKLSELESKLIESDKKSQSENIEKDKLIRELRETIDRQEEEKTNIIKEIERTQSKKLQDFEDETRATLEVRIKAEFEKKLESIVEKLTQDRVRIEADFEINQKRSIIEAIE
ncbi:MAG: hypothetical protein MHMPM18_003281, partial [Marteilia pararefringens]